MFLLSGTVFSQVGINTENPQGIFNIDGKSTTATTNPTAGAPTPAQLSDDVIINKTGATGIGTAPDNYAMLDVSSSNKGILAPRINLTSNTMDLNADGDNNISNQPQGLLVYNIGTTLNKGYYFWNGSEWMVFDSSTTIIPSIENFVCSSATLSPSSWTANTAFTGNLKVSYTGGNGGAYQAGSPVVVNGLTFTLRAGKLEYGAGELVFSVTGTPTTASDMTIPFGTSVIPFMTSAQACNAVVSNQITADIKTIAAMGYSMYDSSSNSYIFPLSTPDGKYKVRVRIASTSAGVAARPNVQLYNNTGSAKTLYWNYETIYGAGTIFSDAGNALSVPAGIWGGAGVGNTWTNSGTGTSVNGWWGNEGINDASFGGPEYRRYTWIDSSTDTKIAYTAYIMTGSPDAGSVKPSNTKIYIKIEQVTAQ